MKLDVIIAALLGYIVGSFSTIILLSLCVIGEGDDDH